MVLTGMLIVSLPTGSFPQSGTGVDAVLVGDLDENGRVDIFDLLLMLRFLSGSHEISPRQHRIADLDRSGDNRVTIFDLLGLLKVLSGIEEPREIVFSNPLARVWAVGDGEKVFRDDVDHPLSLGNSVWDGDTVRLKGLFNEVLAFQLILAADSLGAPEIDVSMDPPVHVAGGETIGGPGAVEYGPGGYVEVFSEHYLHVEVPTNPNWFYGSAAAAPKRMRGWIPDALITPDALPGRGGFPLDIPAGQNQGFWFDVYLPRDTVNYPAGTYRSTLRVRSEGWEVASVPVEITLLPHFLPDENPSNVWLYHDSVEPYYQGTLTPSQIERMLKHTAQRHRINLVGGFRVHHSAFDSTRMDSYRPYLDGSAFTVENGYQGPGQGVGEKLFPIGMYGGSVMGESWSEVYLNSDLWVNWFEANAPRVRFFWYLIDEPGESSFPWIRERAGWIRFNPCPGKRLPIFTTRAYTASLANDIDIWAGYNGVDIQLLPGLKAQGKDHWFYNGNRPRYGSVILEAEAVDFRVNAWVKYLFEIDTWFLWHSSHWRHNSQGPRARTNQRMFEDPVTFISGETSFGNGDGIVFYPGRDPYYPDQDRGVDRIFGSIRLKNIRRGQQDAALMWLAEQKAGRPAVLEIIRSVVPRAMSEVNMNEPVPWSERGDDYDAARDRLLELLER